MKTALALLFFFSLSAQAGSDFLAKTSVPVPGPHGDLTLGRTVADLRSVFLRYSPGLDSQSQIVTPLRVAGTPDHPVVSVSIRRCVLVVCQTVDLDGDVTIRETSGPCARNFNLQVDLSRSSDTLADVYDRLDVAVCYKGNNPDGSGALALEASAHEARNYGKGLVQQELYKMLVLQVNPITRAIQEALKAKNTP